HPPDVFSRQRRKTLGEFRNRFLNKLCSGDGLARRPAGENVVLNLTVGFCSGFAIGFETQRHVVGLAPPKDGVNRAIELSHAITALDLGTVQPVNRAIAPRDETVGAGGNVDDDLSHRYEDWDGVYLRELSNSYGHCVFRHPD